MTTLTMIGTKMTPTTLSNEELIEVLKRVNKTVEERGPARIVRKLAANMRVPTVRVNQDCSVGNISDLVNSFINPRIEDLNLQVACFRPSKPIKNKFGQKTGQNLWSFFRIQDAANDPIFDAVGK